jgi:hypothetical protein
MIEVPLNIFLMGLLDRVRGDSFGLSKGIEQVIYGLFIAVYVINLDPFSSVAFAACFALGSSIGWGEPLGAYLHNIAMRQNNLEWWQVSILKTDVKLALIARGVLWGLPLILLSYLLNDESIALAGMAYMLAFPFAVFVAAKEGKDWEFQEWLRGCLAGALIYVFGS